MRKIVTLILLLVVALVPVHHVSSEASEDFNDLMEQYKRLQAVQEVIRNGLRIYPENGSEGEHAMDANTVVPVILDKEDGKQYAGMPFLITGTLLDIKGYGIDFQLDDGRLCIVSFSEYDSGEMLDFGMYPTKKGERYNIFCTFKSFGWEILSPETYHFTASCTEHAKVYCEKRGK